MLDIIVCSKDSNLMEESINIINMALINYEIDYHIHKFIDNNRVLNELINKENKKIYILDVTLGSKIANIIRKNDFESIIIFLSLDNINRENNDCLGFMALDYIIYDQVFDVRLRNALYLGLKIIYRRDALLFKYNHITYRIPYMNITYIEKEPQLKRCIVHTFGDNYYIVSSISDLNDNLRGTFVRTHQSCIVNTSNVICVDYSNSVIKFINGDETRLLSDNKKHLIRELFINKK